jgi:hypothetical protein
MLSLWARLEPRSVALTQLQETNMPAHKIKLNSAVYSSITDWFALNSNELTWIALATVGVIAAGMLM